MRKAYIDNIRWMTVVLVVIYHVIYMFNGIEVQGVLGPFKAVQYQDAYQYIVYPWFMLLLFVISGMCARFSLRQHGAGEFLKGRTLKLLIPSTVGLFVFWWILGCYNLRISRLAGLELMPKPVLFLVMVLSGIGPLWYIQLLWLFSVLLLAVRRVEKNRLDSACKRASVPFLLGLFFPVWAAAQILNTPMVVVYRFGIYGLGFFLGYFLFAHDEVMERLERWWHILLAAAVVLGAIFVLSFWGEPYAEHSVLDTFLCNLYAWIATLAVLAVMKHWGNCQNAFTGFMGRKAWGLYLFHYLPLAAAAWHLHEAATLPPSVMYLCTGISAFAGALILYELISRIPVLRCLVCGIGGKS